MVENRFETGIPAFFQVLAPFAVAFCLLAQPLTPVALAAPSRIKWQHFSSPKSDLPPPEVGTPTSIVTGDIDRDGTNDFVIAGEGPPSVVWYRWTRAGWQRNVLEPSALPIAGGGLFFDIDQDADLELLIGSSQKGQSVHWYKNPSPNFLPAQHWKRNTLEDEEGGPLGDPLFADFDGNHVKELLYWKDDGTLRMVPSRPIKKHKKWDSQILWSSPDQTSCRGLDFVDVDLDGQADLIGGGYWFQADQDADPDNGKLSAHPIAASRAGGYRSVIADFVSGGRPEVVLAPLAGDGPLTLYQWVEGVWEETLLVEKISSTLDLQVADLDGDGNADLFVSTAKSTENGEGSSQSVFFGDGQGGFEEEPISTSAGPRLSRLADLDGDGDVDLVSIERSPEGKVHVWLNGGTQRKVAVPESPEIDIWYGDHQHIGKIGTPQPWTNVLGTVSAASGISELSYTLNDGPPRSLSMGPNKFRLSTLGDFNADIRRSELREGANVVRILATDALGKKSHHDVTIQNTTGKKWPLPFALDWSQVKNIQDTVEVIDGRWKLSPEGVRTLDIYYDRVLALGDLTWTDYETTVTLKFHRFTASQVSGAPYAQTPQFCILMRWQGHHVDGQQPHAEWRPLGSIAMLRKSYNDPDNVRWFAAGDRGISSKEAVGRKIELETLYKVKMRVETLVGPRSRYSVKVWPKDQQEPADWDHVSEEGADDYQSGSLLLVAHHVDMTIGNILVTPLTPKPLTP